eukprot:scaffold407_cov251-Pinguiococcus_pyrenoidosus.AAC.28
MEFAPHTLLQREKGELVQPRNRDGVAGRGPIHLQDSLLKVCLLVVYTGVRVATTGFSEAQNLPRRAHVLSLQVGFVHVHPADRVAAAFRAEEAVPVRAGHEVLGVRRATHLELVEDVVVLIQLTQAILDVFMHGHHRHGSLLLSQVPHFQREEISRCNKLLPVQEARVGDGRDNLRKEIGLQRASATQEPHQQHPQHQQSQYRLL